MWGKRLEGKKEVRGRGGKGNGREEKGEVGGKGREGKVGARPPNILAQNRP